MVVVGVRVRATVRDSGVRVRVRVRVGKRVRDRIRSSVEVRDLVRVSARDRVGLRVRVRVRVGVRVRVRVPVHEQQTYEEFMESVYGRNWRQMITESDHKLRTRVGLDLA